MRIFLILCLLMVLCLGVFPAAAQEITEIPAPDAPGVESDLAQAFERFLTLINGITWLPVASGFVVVATALFKRIPRWPYSPQATAFAMQVLIWVVWVILRRLGVTEEVFNNTVVAVTTILTAVAGLVASSYGAQWAYDKNVSRFVPVIGYEKPPHSSSG